MQVYSMQCSCGHVMTTDANSREEAIENLKSEMTQEALAAHIQKKHNGGPVPTLSQTHKEIEKQVVQGVLS